MSTVILPARRVHETPRLLVDAYTVGSDFFESKKAIQKSVYTICFRRELYKINPDLYTKGDDRIIFVGLQRILDRLFYTPVTHAEIDAAKEYLKTFKVTTKGLAPYVFNEQMWRRVVDEFNGRPPIHILALPEGSVCYPGEPIVQITSQVEGMGTLAAWFESKLLKVWATTERVTQNEHWFKEMRQMVLEVDPTLSENEIDFFASLMLHDFGDRAGMNEQESEDLGMVHLYTFPGTDTCAGGYQAWMNSNKTPGLSVSVNALAHRNVQSYDTEKECYDTLYEKSDDNTINSYVGDCYNFKNAVKQHLLPLALKSKATGNGKVVVARPDSGDPLDEVLYVIELAIANGLYEERVIDGKTWKFGTFLKFIEGDGMDFATMKMIIRVLLQKGYAPYGWGLFGSGGGLRNSLKRDNTGAKYALAAMGNEDEGVVKLSESLGKSTTPGPHKILRSEIALAGHKTVVFASEEGVEARVEYFSGIRINKPFGEGQDDDFLVVKARIRQQMRTMPLNLTTLHGAPISDAVANKRLELVEKYAPEKLKTYKH